MSTKAKDTPAGLSESLFAGDEIHQREIELPDGSKHSFNFRELSALEFRRFHIAENSGDEDKRAGAVARLIAASLVNPDGSAAITEKQAAKLKTAPASALFMAILEINAAGRPAGNG